MRIVYSFRLAHFFLYLPHYKQSVVAIYGNWAFVGVAQITEDCIGLQPFFVGFKEVFETFGGQNLSPSCRNSKLKTPI